MDNKKITLEDFKAKAIDKFRNRKLVADIYVKGFGEVPFSRPTDNDILNYLNGAAKGAKFSRDDNNNMRVDETDLVPVAEAAKVLVYKSCAFLHDKELQEELDVSDPYDTSFKVFGVNATMEVAEKISDIFSAGEVQKDIKNS